MIKIIGSILIIAATSLAGCRAAMDLDGRYEELKYLRTLMYQLQSEIRYSRAFLGEAFRSLSREAKAPYDAWLRQMYRCMERRDAGRFEKIWGDTTAQYLSGVKIRRAEMKQLVELGRYLGTADTQMQVRHIDFFIEQMDMAMKEMREELRMKKRLCHCLGVMSGIFFAILLI